MSTHDTDFPRSSHSDPAWLDDNWPDADLPDTTTSDTALSDAVESADYAIDSDTTIAEQSVVEDGSGIADLANPYGLFNGDTSRMPAAARAVAIKLKRQRAITGEDFRAALEHMEHVRESLNNDLLVPVINEQYEVMYAEPVAPDNYRMRALKNRTSFNAWEAALLVTLRRKVLEYENVGEAADGWLISKDEMTQALSSGAGPLSGRNSEEWVGTQVAALVNSMKTNGFLIEQDSGDDLYLITTLVPVVLNTERIAAWSTILQPEDDTAGPAITDSSPAEEASAEETNIEESSW